MVFTDLTIVAFYLLQQGLSRKSVKSRAISANTRGTENPYRLKFLFSTDSKAQADGKKEGVLQLKDSLIFMLLFFLFSDQF